jgi:hypothetical protein
MRLERRAWRESTRVVGVDEAIRCLMTRWERTEIPAWAAGLS